MVRPPDRLDAAALTRLATDYLARYAASTQRLRQVLERRVARWHRLRDLPVPDDARDTIDGVVARLAELGLVDDAAFALGRARSLVRKGLPERGIRRALAAEGLDTDAEALDTVLDLDDVAQARRFAARKRLGPYRRGERAAFHDRDIRSLMRAGFSFRAAREVVEAAPDAT